MKKILKFSISCSVLSLLLGGSVGGINISNVLEPTTVYASSYTKPGAIERRYVVSTQILSAQQVRDWAVAVRRATTVNRAMASSISFLGRVLKNPYIAGVGVAAGFAKPYYFNTIQKAADTGKRIKLVVTDSTFHTSYSLQYHLTIIN